MLRQTISNSSRTAGSALRAVTRRPITVRPQFIQTQLQAARAIAPQRATTRWYSSEPAKEGEAPKEEAAKSNGNGNGSGNGNGNGNGNGQESELETLKKQLEAKDAEVRDWKDKYLRSVADFRNLQERTQREMKAARDFAIQKFAKDLVDSVDNFDRALAMVPEEKLNQKEKSDHVQDLVNLYEGLKMTENIMIETLKKHGLERFDPINEKFNPNEHDATFMAPMPDKEHHTVFHTQQKGFKLNGRILRPAKVGVVKNQ